MLRVTAASVSDDQHAAGPGTGMDPLSISEVDHRIANNLAMLSGLVRMRANGAGKASPEEVATLLRETAVQIEAVAHLHRLLSHRPSDTALGICDYLREVCASLAGAFTSCTLLEQHYACEIILPRERALPIALIVAEAVTNAAKYAHPAKAPGRIVLSCTPTGAGALAITVADDGVGLPVDFDPQTDGGLGLRVIRALATQIGAAWRFESGPLGLTFHLEVPAA